MSDFNNAGYDDLRDYITSGGWSHIALINDQGNRETTIDIQSDGRAGWSGSGSNPVTATVNVSGSDTDISAGVTLTGTELLDGASGSVMHGDNFDSANVILASSDDLAIEHDIELPDV